MVKTPTKARTRKKTPKLAMARAFHEKNTPRYCFRWWENIPDPPEGAIHQFLSREKTMTAQNTKTIQYRLRNGQSVEVTINNDGVPGEKVSISDLAIEKTIMCHLGFTEEVSKKHGVAIWRTMDTGMRRFITARTPGMTMMDLIQIAPLFECEPLDVFSNPAICQQLYGEMKLAVTPIVLHEGSLAGVWKVERISSYMPFHIHVNGVIAGENQPVSVTKSDLNRAILEASCRVIGLGKQSYVSFPAGPEGPAEILIMDADLLWQIQFLIGKSIIRAEELDQYITCTMTDEVKSVAIANARNLCRAALTEPQENIPEETESD